MLEKEMVVVGGATDATMFLGLGDQGVDLDVPVVAGQAGVAFVKSPRRPAGLNESELQELAALREQLAELPAVMGYLTARDQRIRTYDATLERLTDNFQINVWSCE